jgi:hypothetical protein
LLLGPSYYRRFLRLMPAPLNPPLGASQGKGIVAGIHVLFFPSFFKRGVDGPGTKSGADQRLAPDNRSNITGIRLDPSDEVTP